MKKTKNINVASFYLFKFHKKKIFHEWNWAEKKYFRRIICYVWNQVNDSFQDKFVFQIWMIFLCLWNWPQNSWGDFFMCETKCKHFQEEFFFCWHFSNLSEKLREHFYRFLFQGRKTFPRNFSRMFLLMLIIPLKFTKELSFFFFCMFETWKKQKNTIQLHIYFLHISGYKKIKNQIPDDFFVLNCS